MHNDPFITQRTDKNKRITIFFLTAMIWLNRIFQPLIAIIFYLSIVFALFKYTSIFSVVPPVEAFLERLLEGQSWSSILVPLAIPAGVLFLLLQNMRYKVLEYDSRADEVQRYARPVSREEYIYAKAKDLGLKSSNTWDSSNEFLASMRDDIKRSF